MTKIDKIKDFEKTIEDNRFSILQLIIAYNMHCNYYYTFLSYEQKEKLIDFIYDIYMKDETKTDLAVFCDAVMNNYQKFLSKEITKNDIYDYI